MNRQLKILYRLSDQHSFATDDISPSHQQVAVEIENYIYIYRSLAIYWRWSSCMSYGFILYMNESTTTNWITGAYWWSHARRIIAFIRLVVWCQNERHVATTVPHPSRSGKKSKWVTSYSIPWILSTIDLARRMEIRASALSIVHLPLV
jgi:hypothetical protein